MKLETLEKTKEKMSFILKDSSPGYANALRRIMISEVPVMAIEDVEFRKNSSAMYDEVIAHRLGLTVLTTDLESYTLPSECACQGEGCARCSLKLTLDEKGPKTVYASDLKTKDPKIKPVHPKTIIAKLLEGQELELEATAVLGKGKDHMKWAPGHVYYKVKPEIRIDESKITNPEAVIAICPMDVFEIKNKKLTVNEKNLLKCHNCEACMDVLPGISFNTEEKDYVVYIESWGQLSPAEIMTTGINLFDKKLEEFDGLMK